MPSVADELAALRAGGGVKARKAGLERGRYPLSTPEAEEAALKAKREQDKLGKAIAKENLTKWGTVGATKSQEMEHSLQQRAKKKAEQDKVKETKKSLSKGSSYVPAASTSSNVAAAVPQAPKEKETTKTNDVAATPAAPAEAPAAPAAVAHVEDDIIKEDAPAADVAEVEDANDDFPNIEEDVTAAPTTDIADATEEKETTNNVAATPAAPAVVDVADAPAEAPAADVAEVEDANDEDSDIEDVAAAPTTDVADVAEVEDDVPDLEEAEDIPELDKGMDNNTQQTTGEEEDAESRQVANRNEKKARKLMQRLGMNPVSGIQRATFKTGGQGGYFFINNPDVYTIGRKTYVIFGEARQGGNIQQQQAAMAQAQAQAAMAQQQQEAAGKMSSVAEEGVEVEELPEIMEDSVDESGVDDKDINLVMSQASCSRSDAVKALKENDNDLVNAIMSLTT